MIDGQSYNYKVHATNYIGDGPISSIVVGVAAEFPSAPYGFEIVTQTSTSLTFSYSIPISDGGLAITSFEVEYDDGLLNFNLPVNLGYQLTYTFSVPVGGVGKLFGFKV